jgi:hypothetical protein
MGSAVFWERFPAYATPAALFAAVQRALRLEFGVDRGAAFNAALAQRLQARGSTSAARVGTSCCGDAHRFEVTLACVATILRN